MSIQLYFALMLYKSGVKSFSVYKSAVLIIIKQFIVVVTYRNVSKMCHCKSSEENSATILFMINLAFLL